MCGKSHGAVAMAPSGKQSWERPHRCGRPDTGVGVIDLGYDLAGAAATELLITGLKRVPGLKRLL